MNDLATPEATTESATPPEGIYAAEDTIHEIGVTVSAKAQEKGETLSEEERGLALELYGEEVGKQIVEKLEAAVEPDIFAKYGIDVAKEVAAKAAIGEELSPFELMGMLVGKQLAEKMSKQEQGKAVSMESAEGECEAPKMK